MGHLIDWHTHCWLPEHRSTEDADLWKLRGVAGTGKADPEAHQAAIEAAGAEQFVVVAIPRRGAMCTPNEFIAEFVGRFPGRAVGLSSVDPEEPDAADEFEHAITALGLKGIKLSPVYQYMDPRSANCYKLYEIAQAHKVPVMYHVGGAYTGSLEFGDPFLLDKVAYDFPDMKIIVAHFGQPYMEQTCILMRKNENIFADLSARFHRPWQLYHGIMIAQEYRVTDRLLFGSDFPVRTTAEALAEFRAINEWGQGANMPRIPEDIIEGIINDRPLSLLGIDPAGD
ncbi:MAG: amidohydrolase family protein [Alphaproteobacteria bacterium]